MADDELLEMLIGLVQKNTEALEGVKDAIKDNAEKNKELRGEMTKMVKVITGAQRQVGDKLGPIIDRSKNAADALDREARAAIDARRGPRDS
jgi:DNA-directed RNA polymerase